MIILLFFTATFISIGIASGKNMWLCISIYWMLVALKYLIDYRKKR